MRIKRITLKKYDRPFRFKFHNTQTLRTHADSVIIQLEFENGILGCGESTPMDYITGEDCTTVVQVIEQCFSPILFSSEIDSVVDIENLLNKLEEGCIRRDMLYYNSALGGIDIALLDALGKLRESPLANVLGMIVRESASYSITIPFLPPRKIAELSYQLPKSTIRYVKVLVGEVESENVQRLELVRSLFGEDVEIRLENNGKWTFSQAISNLRKLEQYNIAAVEQPIAKDNIEDLRRLKKAIRIPIVVDESMCSLSDAKDLIAREACDILNIKISKCGGLIRSRRIAQFAESQNVLCQLGAHVGETEILRQAGKAFALTTANLVYFEGCSVLLFENSWEKSLFKIESKAENDVFNFGLGIESVDQQLIEKYSLPISDMVSNTGIRSI
jgi:L-alanine-DL-glutamate epimerase-like enolase superfamily enzyme